LCPPRRDLFIKPLVEKTGGPQRRSEKKSVLKDGKGNTKKEERCFLSKKRGKRAKEI